MSNLSELLPAGGAAKEFEPVASGTLPNGRAVILKANGQVEAVGETTLSQTIPAGSGAQFDSGSGHDGVMTAYDPTTAGRFAVVYSDANGSSYGTIAIGQVSGTSITFGTAIVFVSAWSHAPRLSWSPHTSGQLAIATGRSSKGRIVIGNVSGSNVTFGSESIFFNTGIPDHYDMAFDPITANRLVCVYRDPNNSGYGMGIVGTVSGTSVSFGTAVIFRSTNVSNITLSFDPNTANQFVVSYGMQVNSGYGQAVIGTLSSTSVSFGSSVTYTAGAATFHYVSYDQKIAGKFYAAFQDSTNSDRGTAVCCTVSGTTISVGQIVVFNSGATQYVSIAGDPNTANQFLVSYRDNGNSGYGTAVRGTVSGTVISYAASTVYSATSTAPPNVVFDPNNAGQFVVSANVPTGRSVLGQIAASVTNLTSTNFVGITAEAITSGATGVVVPQGGVAASVANTPLLQVYGSEVVFNTSNVAWPTMDFDPNTAGKFVAVYSDNGNSNYGTAIVGIVSGNSITYGSKFVFETAAANDICISFDPNTANKFVIAYQDAGSSSNGTAIVGTVSGTSLSFGTKAVFNSGDSSNIGLDCDPNTANKYVISYRNSANNNEGIALVGTVSGTSISFGSKVTFNSGITGKTSPAFDPNTSGKFVQIWINYSVSNYAEACVGTVSGTSISFGSTVTFDTGGMNWNKIAPDPNTAGKYVIAYTDQGNSSYGTAIVGTVSGTSISFGTSVVYNSGTTSYNSIGFDPNNSGKCVIAYMDTPNSSSGTAVMGTVSGTSISFGSEVVFNGNSSYFTTVFDPNTSGKYVISYRDSNGPGAAIVGNLSSALTIGSNYYVQADGSVSTVSTSPAVNIGKAISATSLILKG